MMWDHLLTLGVAAVLLLATYGIGRPLFRLAIADETDALESGVWSIALGLLIAGGVFAALGQIGWLQRQVIVPLTCVALCWGMFDVIATRLSAWQSRVIDLRRAPPLATSLAAWPSPPRWLMIFAYVAAGIAALASLAGALSPATDVASLSRSLAAPKEWLLRGAIDPTTHMAIDDGVRLSELWTVWAMALGAPAAAGVFHWAIGLVAALAGTLLARPLIGHAWANVVGAAMIATPAAIAQMSTVTPQLALMMFAALALSAWWRAAACDEPTPWYFAAGAMLAGATIVDRAGIMLFVAVMGVHLAMALRTAQRRESLFRGMTIMLCVAGAAMLLWRVIHGGSFSGPVIGIGELPTVGLFLWACPLIVAVLPGLVLVRRLRGVGAIMSVAGIYVGLCCAIGSMPLSLVPMLSVLLIASIWVVIEVCRLPVVPRVIAAVSFASIATISCVAAAINHHDSGPLAIGLETRDEYLLRHLPECRVTLAANSILTPHAHVLSQDPRAYLLNCRVTYQPHRQNSSDESIARLRLSGFTHLLVIDEDLASDQRPALNRRIDASLADSDDDPDLLLPARFSGRDSTGSVRTYRLVMIR
jgi:hypothetical protein